MSFNIYLVRHGQTILNRYNRMQGWCDSPLTPQGMLDGHMAGQHLSHINFAHAYHSDTTRAEKTCHFLLQENVSSPELPEPTELPAFREQSYGYFEGSDSDQAWLMVGAAHGCRSFHEMVAKYSMDDTKDFTKQADPFHQAEDAAEYWKRVDSGFDYLKKVAADNDNILVVSHGTTIRSIASRFDAQLDATVGPKNGSITKLVVDGDQIQVAYFNQVDDNFKY